MGSVTRKHEEGNRIRVADASARAKDYRRISLWHETCGDDWVWLTFHPNDAAILASGDPQAAEPQPTPA